MNWRYIVDKDEIILTPEEHFQILDGMKQRANLITLRNGKLGINPMFVRKFSETEQLTDEQLDRRTKTLALEDKPFREMTPFEQEERRNQHNDFMQRFGKKIDWRMNKS